MLHTPEIVRGSLDDAIVRTIAYADVFDQPLSTGEITRYLIACQASVEEVSRALQCRPVRDRVEVDADLFFLRGRRAIVETRRSRSARAAEIWPRAIKYGRTIGRLPFIRMVAVSGALAVDNAGSGTDIDYFIVTANGRLWLSRAETIALVRVAALRRDVVCPNYFVSERSLTFPERTLFVAHEIAQMVPITGQSVYKQLRRDNDWTHQFLPNAIEPARVVSADVSKSSIWRRQAERIGGSPIGGWFESWEMTRKVRRFERAAAGEPEAAFSADLCKGHVNGHGRRILAAYADRLAQLGVPD